MRCCFLLWVYSDRLLVGPGGAGGAGGGGGSEGQHLDQVVEIATAVSANHASSQAIRQLLVIWGRFDGSLVITEGDEEGCERDQRCVRRGDDSDQVLRGMAPRRRRRSRRRGHDGS